MRIWSVHDAKERFSEFLDTCLREGPQGAVLAWIEKVDNTDLHLSAVTIGEIQAGIEMTRETDARKAAEIEAFGSPTFNPFVAQV